MIGEDDEGDDGVIDDDRADADALVDDLAGIAFDQAGGAAVLLTANTPVRIAPMMPPTPWTPKQSSASS